MKVMLIMKATNQASRDAYETARPPSEEALLAMHAFNEELAKAGVLLDLGGLKPTKHAVRIQYADGKRTVIDGPFAEAKELIAGFSMIQVKSMAEAIEWAKRGPFAVGQHVGETFEVELRPLYDASDFDPPCGS